MTKAERLFKKNYYACKRHVEYHGFNGIGFATLECEDDDLLPTRTLNDIQKHIDRQRKQLEIRRRLNGDYEDAEIWEDALEMLQLTLDNQRKVNKKWDKWLMDN